MELKPEELDAGPLPKITVVIEQTMLPTGEMNIDLKSHIENHPAGDAAKLNALGAAMLLVDALNLVVRNMDKSAEKHIKDQAKEANGPPKPRLWTPEFFKGMEG